MLAVILGVWVRCELHRQRLINFGPPAERIHVNFGGGDVLPQLPQRGPLSVALREHRCRNVATFKKWVRYFLVGGEPPSTGRQHYLGSEVLRHSTCIDDRFTASASEPVALRPCGLDGTVQPALSSPWCKFGFGSRKS